MKIYLPFTPPKAMTFDLDDTFYDNWPFIVKAENALSEFIAQHYPEVSYRPGAWQPFKKQALATSPELHYDMGRLRHKTLELGFADAGLSGDRLAQATQRSFEHFYHARSDFTVEQRYHNAMAELASKIPLIAITNGNVNVAQIGLGQYFQAVFHASIAHRAKPHRDMFDKALAELELPAHEVMHIGDNAYNDVYAGYRIGMSTAWFAADRAMQINNEPFTNVPHVQLDCLTELTQLV